VRTPYVVLTHLSLTQAQRIRSQCPMRPTQRIPMLGGRTTSRNMHRSLTMGTRLPLETHTFLCQLHHPHQAEHHTTPLRRNITPAPMRHMNHLNRPVTVLYRKTLARACASRLYHKEWMRRTGGLMIHVPTTHYFATHAAPGKERHSACAFVPD